MQNIGLMPEENFLYWDDTEWGYRCNLSGSRVAAYGKSKVWHAMGAKKEAVNTFPTYYAWRNWLRFFVRYTPAEFREVMARAFVGEIFENVYTGLYRGEENRFKTILLACDDALHGVTGKAPEGRIFAIDDTAFQKRLTDMVNAQRQIYIIAGEYVTEALALAQEIDRLVPERCIELFEREEDLAETGRQDECDGQGEYSGQSEHGGQNEGIPLYITVCESIFRLPEAETEKIALKQDGRKRIFMDLEGNFLETPEDIKLAVSYPAARETFLRAYMPVFMDLAGRFDRE